MASPRRNVFALREIQLANCDISPENAVRCSSENTESTRASFSSYTVQELKQYLGERRLKVEGSKQELATLAFWAWKLNLPKNPTEIETQQLAKQRLDCILQLDGEASLPHPQCLTNWSSDPKLVPQFQYGNLYNYLIDTPGIYNKDSLGAFKALDAYNYVYCGWVDQLRVHTTASKFVFVATAVRPSQHTTIAPYDVWALVHQEGWVKGARCCCMAGLGEACSHVGALLFMMLAVNDLGLNKADTCTDIPAQWKKAFRTDLVPMKLQNIDFSRPQYGKRHVRKKQPKEESDDSDEESLWDIVAEAAPNAVILTAIDPVGHHQNSIADVSSHVIISQTSEYVAPAPTIASVIADNADVDLIGIKSSINSAQSDRLFQSTKLQGRSQLWHKHRRGRITASKMGDVYRTASKSSGAVSSSVVQNILSDTLKPGRAPKPLQWGSDNEEKAKQAYLTHMGTIHPKLTVTPAGLYVKPGEAHLGASTDGVVSCECCGPRLLEIKCPYSARDTTPQHAALDYLTGADKNGKQSLIAHHKYYIQVQGQMALMGFTSCDFVVWTPKGLIVDHVHFDEPLWESVKPFLDRFYSDYVLSLLKNKDTSPEAERVLPEKAKKRTISSRGHPGKKRQKLDSLPQNAPQPKKSGRTKKVRWPCPVCGDSACENSVACEGCDRWFHFSCVKLTGSEEFLADNDFVCTDCVDVL